MNSLLLLRDCSLTSNNSSSHQSFFLQFFFFFFSLAALYNLAFSQLWTKLSQGRKMLIPYSLTSHRSVWSSSLLCSPNKETAACFPLLISLRQHCQQHFSPGQKKIYSYTTSNNRLSLFLNVSTLQWRAMQCVQLVPSSQETRLHFLLHVQLIIALLTFFLLNIHVLWSKSDDLRCVEQQNDHSIP